MPIQILMPALSPTMEEGKIARWLKQEGDRVEPGDIIAEIETDKATMEYEATDEGTLGKILVPEGTEGVKVNTPIAILLEEGEDESALAEVEAAGAAGAAPAAAPASSGAGAAESAAAPGGPAPASAPPVASAAPAAPTAPAASAAAPSSSPKGRRIFASPLARRLARELGIDLSTVTGSGPHGRIIKADVERAAAAPRPAAPAAPAVALPAGPDVETVRRLYEGREFEELALDNMRRTIATRLVEAKQTIPHFYLRREILLDRLLATRARLNARLKGRAIKLSVNDFIIKASALALQEVPDCNAVWAGDRILRFKASDVAVAVAVEGGLFTPVIRDAEKKSLAELSTEMKDLATRARARRLAPHEYQGGSFAISNLGMYGIDNFDAVINPPHASILAVGAGVKRPVVAEDGSLTAATVMSVTLSVDHRVIDGALGARFLEALKAYLEEPALMLA